MCSVFDQTIIDEALTAIKAGELIVMPTDTVYGVAADAFSSEAVGKLRAAKKRGRDMPPPVLISDFAVASALATRISPTAQELLHEFWPGALTAILPIQPSLRLDLGETGGSIALRVPDHQAVREFLRLSGPLAVSSANVTGNPAARSIEEAKEQLGDSISVYLPGEPSGSGPASTIIDFTVDPPQVRRNGGLALDVVQKKFPTVVNMEVAT